MDSTTTYLAFRHDGRPHDCVASFGAHMGRRPSVVIVHPSERDALAVAITPAGIAVDTLPHGGPHPGELWLA